MNLGAGPKCRSLPTPRGDYHIPSKTPCLFCALGGSTSLFCSWYSSRPRWNFLSVLNCRSICQVMSIILCTFGKIQDKNQTTRQAIAFKPFAGYYCHDTAPTSLDMDTLSLLCILTTSIKTGLMQDYVGGFLLRAGGTPEALDEQLVAGSNHTSRVLSTRLGLIQQADK